MALTALIVEIIFLIAIGSSWITSSSQGFPQTQATRALQHIVRNDAVGFGRDQLDGNLGIAVNANASYRVHEIAGYDPMIPKRTFDSWRFETGRYEGVRSLSTFQPAFKSLHEAQVWGARWIIEPLGVTGPLGTQLVAQLGNQSLWKVPHSWQASQAPLNTPVGDPRESGIDLRWRSPSSATATLFASSASIVRLRILNVPGWSASIDGRPAQVHAYAGAMMEVNLPTGHHTLSLRYLPRAFVLGLIVAVVALLMLLSMIIVNPGGRLNRLRKQPQQGQ